MGNVGTPQTTAGSGDEGDMGSQLNGDAVGNAGSNPPASTGVPQTPTPPANNTPSTPVGMVPESDLMAVKRSLTGQLDELRAQLDQERAARTAAEGKASQVTDLEARIADLSSKVQAAAEKEAQAAAAALQASKDALQKRYNLTVEDVQDLDARELAVLERTLSKVSPNAARPPAGSPRGYGVEGSGEGNPFENLRGMDKISAALKNGLK